MIVLAWVLVVLALLVTLALCTVMLFRRFVLLLAAFADFASLPAILDGVHRADPEPRATPAVLRPRAQVAAEHAARHTARLERRSVRRAARIARGRALITAR